MIELTWPQFKTGVIEAGIIFRVIEDDATYLLLAKDKIEFKCKIDKSSDNSEKLEFESSFKSKAVSMLEPVDAEGASVSRGKAAKAGWKAQFHSIRISTATVGGVYNKNKSGQDIGFCTYTMYDVNGQVTADVVQCVKTVVTWEPTHNMEIVGGRLLQRSAPTTDVWMYVTAAAHIPAQYGGSVTFTDGGINLYDVGDGGETDFDGRAAKFVAYDPINHSGRFEILLKHDAGVQHSFSLIFELFKP